MLVFLLVRILLTNDVFVVVANLARLKLVHSLRVVKCSYLGDLNFILVVYRTIISGVHARFILLTDLLEDTTMWGRSKISIYMILIARTCTHLLCMIYLLVRTNRCTSYRSCWGLLPNGTNVAVGILLRVHALLAYHGSWWVLCSVGRSGQWAFDANAFGVHDDAVGSHSLSYLRRNIALIHSNFAWTLVV